MRQRFADIGYSVRLNETVCVAVCSTVLLNSREGCCLNQCINDTYQATHPLFQRWDCHAGSQQEAEEIHPQQHSFNVSVRLWRLVCSHQEYVCKHAVSFPQCVVAQYAPFVKALDTGAEQEKASSSLLPLWARTHARFVSPMRHQPPAWATLLWCTLPMIHARGML